MSSLQSQAVTVSVDDEHLDVTSQGSGSSSEDEDDTYSRDLSLPPPPRDSVARNNISSRGIPSSSAVSHSYF